MPDFSTPPAADGCTTEIWTATFDADITYVAGRSAPAGAPTRRDR
jgi:hypothetical protein